MYQNHRQVISRSSAHLSYLRSGGEMMTYWSICSFREMLIYFWMIILLHFGYGRFLPMPGTSIVYNTDAQISLEYHRSIERALHWLVFLITLLYRILFFQLYLVSELSSLRICYDFIKFSIYCDSLSANLLKVNVVYQNLKF